mmetsp:Transcript_10418/g.29712  ORF Transcript_10418/g.29712 Transcript_10418/m.29712 type:complete len:211 (+) Transcript_10418:3-635(+)
MRKKKKSFVDNSSSSLVQPCCANQIHHPRSQPSRNKLESFPISCFITCSQPHTLTHSHHPHRINSSIQAHQRPSCVKCIAVRGKVRSRKPAVVPAPTNTATSLTMLQPATSTSTSTATRTATVAAAAIMIHPPSRDGTSTGSRPSARPVRCSDLGTSSRSSCWGWWRHPRHSRITGRTRRASMTLRPSSTMLRTSSCTSPNGICNATPGS